MKLEDLTPDVLSQYDAYIKSIVRRTMKIYPKNPRWDSDDIEGIVLWAFVESWKSYDDEKYKDVPFKAYARRHIVNRIKKFVAVNIFTLKANYQNLKANNPDEITRLHDMEVNAVREYNLYDSDTEETFESYCRDNSPHHEEEVDKKDLKREVRRLINNLSGYDRRLYRLRYVENNTLEQISKKVGRSIMAIKNDLTKLNERLKNSPVWQQLQ